MKKTVKTTFLVFAVFLAFVLVGAIYSIIVSPNDTVDMRTSDKATSTFQGPVGPPTGFEGPSEPPPGL